jgi:hypothetical protein
MLPDTYWTIVKPLSNFTVTALNWHIACSGSIALVPLKTMPEPSPESPKIIRLPRNGPKPGQSVEAWLAGKQRSEERALERDRWKAMHKKKGA